MTEQTRDLPHFPFAGPPQDPFSPALSPDGRRLPPVAKVSLPLGNWAWLISSHQELKEMLRSPSFSADVTHPGFPLLRPALGLSGDTRTGMFSRMDHPDHTRYRRLLAPEFSVKSMKRHVPLIRATVGEVLDEMERQGPAVDLLDAFARPVPSAVICTMLGVPYEDHAFFRECSHHMNSLASSAEQSRQATEELREYLTRLVLAKRTSDWVDDVLGRLAGQSVEGEPLTTEELVGAVLLLLVAGHETTVNMIALSTLVLLRHPEQYRALATNPGQVGNTVEELLRFLTPMRTGARRVAIEDCVIGGQAIQAGEGVIALLSAANRDETVFPQPDTFDPGRDARPHVAFGFGAHQCIGQHLGRFELQVALAELARRFPGLTLAVSTSELQVRSESVVFGIGSLPVSW